MAGRAVRLSLRRVVALTGAVVLLAAIVTGTALAGTPSPDPPPLAVAPEAPPVAKTVSAPVRTAPTVVQSPVVQRAAPVVRARARQAPTATPKPAKAKPKAAVKRPTAATGTVTRVPHDRARVPFVAFVTADELNRGLLAVGGVALLLVALGGAILVCVARRQLALAVTAFFLVLTPNVNSATPPVTFSLAGNAGANGWFVSNVTLTWTVQTQDLISTSGCDAVTVFSEGTTTKSCNWEYTWGTGRSDAVIRIDKTAPAGVSGSMSRAPDSDGWYNHPVAASFSGQDAVSGVGGCSSPAYAGGDGAAVGLSGTCTDVAGNVSAMASVGFKYDATPPAVTPTPDRQPDNKGWYRKPVIVTFAGADAGSGIAACSAPAQYAGPDLAKAVVTGSCRDRAGNSAEATHTLAYDATAPKLARVKAEVDKGIARLGWVRADDVVRVEIVRSPGLNGAKRTTVYTGRGAAFADRTVRAGVRYRYALSVADVAGNVTTKTVTALERAVLYSPAAAAVLRTPPLLRWQGVAGAKFYNVQLYRNGVKILSIWPRSTKFQLARAWSYGGKRQRLEPGLYRWYVWPARGTKERPAYGRALGSSTFRVAG